MLLHLYTLEPSDRWISSALGLSDIDVYYLTRRHTCNSILRLRRSQRILRLAKTLLYLDTLIGPESTFYPLVRSTT